MGLILDKIKEEQDQQKRDGLPVTFPDLSNLPPELAISVLSHLNATDLCLAACVWQELAEDDILWQGLCKAQWRHVTVYSQPHNHLYRRLFLLLDEASLTFNNDCFTGMKYLFDSGLLENDPKEIAKFFYNTRKLNRQEVRRYTDARREILDCLVRLFSFKNMSLPNAMRKFFMCVEAPNDRGNYLQTVLRKFSAQYCSCNSHLRLHPDTVLILCYSLIMLSVDLCSPHVKNKMSKREFIRNVRNAVHQPIDDMSGHLYDDIYLQGHVVPSSLAR